MSLSSPSVRPDLNIKRQAQARWRFSGQAERRARRGVEGGTSDQQHAPDVCVGVLEAPCHRRKYVEGHMVAVRASQLAGLVGQYQYCCSTVFYSRVVVG